MVDIHNHILWGIDDGAKTSKDTLAMAKAAADNGINYVIATPHHYDGKYLNPPATIHSRLQEANALIQKNKIDLTILPGMEVHLHGEIAQDLATLEERLVPLAGNTNYILIELPYDHVPRYTETLFFDIQLKGFIPVIAHPERNVEIRDNPNVLYELVKKGALSQVTAASIAGLFGDTLQKLALKLIKSNLVHFIASDAHNTQKRGFALKEAYHWLDTNLDESYTDYFIDNAAALVQNKRIYIPEPKAVRKKIFGLF